MENGRKSLLLVKYIENLAKGMRVKLCDYLVAYGIKSPAPRKYMRYGWWQFEKDCRILAGYSKPHKMPGGTSTSLYGIPRGGMVVAVRLSYMTGLPLVERSAITSTTLVVDDIVGTGRTIAILKQETPTNLFAALIAVKMSDGYESGIIVHCARIIPGSVFVKFPWAPEDIYHE